MELYPYQQDDVARYLNEPSYAGLIGSVVGTGKTPVAVTISEKLDSKMDVIVAPVNTEDGWTRHYLEMQDRKLLRVGGSTKSQKDNMLQMLDNKPGVYFMTWEYARAQGNFDDLRPDFVIADEVHRAQNRKAAQAAAYHSLAHSVFSTEEGRVLALSGTPAGNRLTGLWSVAHGLWPERYGRYSRSKPNIRPLAYWKWCEKFFNETASQYTDLGYEYIDEKVVGGVTKDLPFFIRHEQGHNCCVFHPRGVQEDLPPRVWHDVVVDLSAKQRSMYKKMERDMILWMEGHDIPITSGGLPMVNHLRLLQICLGEPTPEMIQAMDKDGNVETSYTVTYPLDTKSTKIDAVLDILSDHPAGEPMLIWTHSRGIIPAIVHQVNNSRKFTGHVATNWDGTVSPAQRAWTKQHLGNGGPNIVVAQIDSLAEGVDGLQRVCNNEIWFSKSANGVANDQSLGRLARDGQTRTINAWNLCARDTVEVQKEERLDLKSKRLVGGLHV